MYRIIHSESLFNLKFRDFLNRKQKSEERLNLIVRLNAIQYLIKKKLQFLNIPSSLQKKKGLQINI